MTRTLHGIEIPADAPDLPCFYAECAYLDGLRDAREGHSDSRPSYIKWEIPEPGMRWYEMGRAAAK